MINYFLKADLHTKIFIIIFLFGILLTLIFCLYPYFWFDQHRSVEYSSSFPVNREKE